MSAVHWPPKSRHENSIENAVVYIIPNNKPTNKPSDRISTLDPGIWTPTIETPRLQAAVA